MKIDIHIPSFKGIETHEYRGIERALDAGCNVEATSSWCVPYLRLVNIRWPEKRARQMRPRDFGIGNRDRKYIYAVADGESSTSLRSALQTASQQYLRTFHSIVDFTHYTSGKSLARGFLARKRRAPGALRAEDSLDDWVLRNQLLIAKKDEDKYVVTLNLCQYDPNKRYDPFEEVPPGRTVATATSKRLGMCFNELSKEYYDASDSPCQRRYTIFDGAEVTKDQIIRSLVGR